MPTKLPRVMVSIHDADLGPVIGAEVNATTLSGVLARYAALVRRGARELDAVLDRAEWNAIADANNGCADLHDYTPGGPSTAPLLMIRANLQDSPGLGEKWRIDQTALVKKLGKLRAHHGEAILCAVRWFWSHCDECDHIEDPWWTPEFRCRRAAQQGEGA